MKERKEFNPADWKKPAPEKSPAKPKPQRQFNTDKLDDVERLTQAIEARSLA